MIYQDQALAELFRVFLTDTLISISGEAGTGKTTLAQYLVGNLLAGKLPFFGSCIWVQASEKFPHKRLTQLFYNFPERLEYLKQHIYLTPQSSYINSYDVFLDILHHLSEKDSILPPDLRYIVVDNISHHLRYEISRIRDIKQIINLQDNFYENLLLPLIMFCQRNNTHLILLHENTFVPQLNVSKPFFYKLYDRISHVHIILTRTYKSSIHNLTIHNENSMQAYKYIIQGNGFVLL
ncbi:MAG: AAA family ATPase [Promethearchaeota archaeon]|jgi:hypothetical protein